MPIKLTVPTRAIEVLRALAAKDEQNHVEVRKAVATATAFATPDALVQVFIDTLGFDREQSQALVAEVFSLAHAVIEHGHTAESAARDVVESSELAIEPVIAEDFRATVEALLSAPALRGLASAASVFTAHARLFTSARVHVDIRPVFDEARERTVGSIVTRKLQIGYFEEGDYKTFEVALQEAGYDELLTTLEAGRREAGVTEDMLATAGMTVYKFDDSERSED